MDDASSHLGHLFLARLRQARERVITIRVSVFQPTDVLSTTILPAVSAHSHHVVQLSLNVHVDLHSAAFAAVAGFMPMLERLALRFTVAKLNAAAPILPIEVFGAWQNTKIRHLELHNVAAPTGALPALSTVHELRYTMPRAPSAPIREGFLAAFPRIETLHLSGTRQEGFSRAVIAACLRVDCVRFSDSLKDAIFTMNLAPARHIAVQSADARLAQHLLDHIGGNVVMTVMKQRGRADTFIIAFLDGRRFRSFLETLSHYTSGVCSNFFTSLPPTSLERVVTLDCSDMLWNVIVPFLPCLPGLVFLHITLHNSSAPTIGTSPLHCVALQKVSLVSGEARQLSLDAARLRDFIVQSIAGARLPLQLYLDERVVLHGGHETLQGIFILEVPPR